MPRWEPHPTESARADELVKLLGLDALTRATWPTMSQGERGRALIARALMPDPPLLLLDEPSTGLDVAAREQLLATVDHLHRSQPELATVLVTHHLEELPETTTHAALIKDGRLIHAGPAQDVLTTERVTECFSYPIEIGHHAGRWHARALPQRPHGDGHATIPDRR
ncbi:ATP-binding cassette domain-containing protein [Nocardioides alcanivorans]|uniref:ATP-binding cassette domain-containing protein n=1 Tax=Nocardioides alcanivorans TaxID=2897352 RepID=UPI0024B139A1|nr:ATP-binding cassette domain-containing protein [Nocardioides alcanivorans]